MINIRNELDKPNSERHRRMRGGILIRAIPFLLFFLFFAANSHPVSASIFNMPKLDVVSDGNTVIGPQYSFVPQFTERSQLITFGSTAWRDIRWDDTDGRGFRGIDLNHPTNLNHLKGRIGATYTNVGYYNGESLDLKITLIGWHEFGNVGKSGTAAAIGNISFEKHNIAVSTQGYTFVDMNWQYVRSGTDTPVRVAGYFTFGDIDLRQGLEFDSITSQNIDKFLVEDRSNLLHYHNNSGRYDIYDITNVDVPDTIFDHRHAFTFLYSDIPSFSIRWSTDWVNSPRLGRPVTPSRNLYTNTRDYAAGEYLYFVLNKPLPTEVPKPKKSVNITHNLKTTDRLVYTIEHTIPQEDPKFYYSNYRLTDTLDKTLINPSVKVLDAYGNNITSRFNTNISGKTVTIEPTSSELRHPRFYGQTIRYVIEGDIDVAEMDEIMEDADSYTIPNKATIVVDGKSNVTNEVTSQINTRGIIVNHIDDVADELILQETYKMYDGEDYEFFPRNDLTRDDGFSYKPRSTTSVSGTVDGESIVIDFYYHVPKMTVGLERIEIYTKQQSSNPNNGLPTHVRFSDDLSFGSTLEDFEGGKLRFVITDTDHNRDVYDKLINVEDIESEIETALRTDYLSKNMKINYDFKFTVDFVGVNNYELVTEPPLLKTFGYTATEEVFTEDVDVSRTIRTVKEPNTPVMEDMERLILKSPVIDPQKTGYGFEAEFNTVYSNDLKNLADIHTDYYIDERMIDSNLQFDPAGNMSKILLDRTKNAVSNGSMTVTSTFELPKVHIEHRTGYLYSNANDSRIKYSLLDGGRMLYSPIWSDLGVYDYAFKSRDVIGVNLLSFDIKNDFELTAFMFSHIDSDTEPDYDDEILIHQKREE